MKQGFIYFIALRDEFVKIGYSTTPLKRFSSLQVGCPYPLKLVGLIPGTKEEEAEVQEMFSSWHVRGEWYRFNNQIWDYIHDQEILAEG